MRELTVIQEPEADEVTASAVYYDIAEIEEVLTYVYYKAWTAQDVFDKLSNILDKNREYLIEKANEEDNE